MPRKIMATIGRKVPTKTEAVSNKLGESWNPSTKVTASNATESNIVR